MARSRTNEPLIFQRPSKKQAERRMAAQYPSEWEKVKELRQTHGILYELKKDVFDRILKETLNGLIIEGHCKRPKF
jgi:hypothetical protein